MANVAASSPTLDLMLYLDKTGYGNERRPDIRQSKQCLYWSIKQFPPWFLSRKNGWLPFAYVSAGDQKTLKINDGALTKFLIDTFDNDQSDLAISKGFALHGPDGQVTIMRFSHILRIKDWERHVKTVC